MIRRGTPKKKKKNMNCELCAHRQVAHAHVRHSGPTAIMAIPTPENCTTEGHMTRFGQSQPVATRFSQSQPVATLVSNREDDLPAKVFPIGKTMTDLSVA